MTQKTIISASRRTDLPAFYTDWLLNQFDRGFAEVINPYNQKIHQVDLSPAKVHSVVLWSKNFTPLFNKIQRMSQYQLFFMFTLNDCPALEPNVPDWEQRLNQLKFLIQKFGKERIFLRYDPIVFWKDDGKKENSIKNNLASFEKIAQSISRLGFHSLITSFMDNSYKKLKMRKISFWDISLEKKQEIIANLAQKAKALDIKLKLCSNEYLFGGNFEKNMDNIEKSSCINGNEIYRIIQEPVSFRKDPSQRKECLCTISRDIGSYRQKCFHSCHYCYANPHL